MKGLLLLLPALLSAACTSSSEGEDGAPEGGENVSAGELTESGYRKVTIDPSRGQAGTDGLTWTFFRSEGGRGFSVLLYGPQGSDGAVIVFQCRTPERITLIQFREPGAQASQELVLGSHPVTASAQPELSEPDAMGQVQARAELAADHELLRAFRSTGLLTVNGPGGPRSADAIDDVEKGEIRRFFSACGPTG